MDFAMPKKSVAVTGQFTLSRPMLIFARIGDDKQNSETQRKGNDNVRTTREKTRFSSSVLKEKSRNTSGH
jgi:hypothetical protein